MTKTTNWKVIRHYLILVAFLTVLIALTSYIFLPAWNIHSVGFWFFGLWIFGAGAIYELIWLYFDDEDYERTTSIVFGIICALIVLVLIVGGLTSSHMFSSQRYRDQIQIVDGNFIEQVPLVENAEKEVPITDKASARKLGDRTLGQIERVSQYEVADDYKLIMYNGQQYRLAPLEYGGLFKFLKNKAYGIPGYVLVDTISQEANYVTQENTIKYAPTAYWSHDLYRHLRNNYPSYMFEDSWFEVDEEGQGYYIAPVLEARIGLFGCKTVKSVIIVNATTGECIEYFTNEVPDWVDVVYSVKYIMRKINDHYRYVLGFFNFSSTDIKKTSYEYASQDFAGYTAMISNGEVVYFTGVTSSGNDESNLGFLLISARTGEVRYYTCPGAEESSAQSSAEGLVQNWGYKAGYPMIINVDGVETYFMTLKDDAGLIKKVALVNCRSYNVAVCADTIPQAIEQYRKAISGKMVPQSNEAYVKTGIITCIFTAQIGGDTHFYYMFEEDENLYKASILISDMQVKLQVGDLVEIKFQDTVDEDLKTVTEIISK